MDKRGISLIFVLGILAVLMIIAVSFVSLVNSEGKLVARQTNSMRAFYLAEAGLENAIYNLKKGNDTNFSGALYSASNEYDVVISGVSPYYTVTSTGSYPNLTNPDKVTRRVSVDVTAVPSNPAAITSAIELNGELQTSGSVTINGTVKENQALDFQAIFGMTKEAIEAIADNRYTDPLNNQVPVDRITWVNLVDNSSFMITESGWNGSGILVVKGTEGPSTDVLKITGGVFHGIIWVIGNLRISGNPEINGAVFVENGSAEVTGITGNPTINYNSSDVQDALSGLGSYISGISNWQEIP